MSSDNPSGADNQQETAKPRLELDPQWIVGFVDGEGCFCVSVHRNRFARSTGGWQLHPVFQVYQHERYRAVLGELVVFFGCGRIRPKGPKSSVLTFAVDSLRDLERAILPFFERYPLVVKEHLTRDGFERAVRLAYGMNAAGKQRARSLETVLAGSSETARQALRVEQ